MKKMKKNKLIFYSLIMWSLINCSENKLEEITPEDNIPAALIFTNFSTIEATTVGIYDGMQNGDIIGGQVEFIGDFLSDDVNFVGSYPSLQQLRNFYAASTNRNVNDIWFNVFNVTRNANNIIENLAVLSSQDITFSDPNDFETFETRKQEFIAEARFCRALVTFIGANLFAHPYQVENGENLGMPIVTAFFAGDEGRFKEPRATLNETHTFIENDLLFAVNNLSDFNGIRASSTAAKALLSRLYLYREQWSEAANMANAVINTSGFSLAPDYTFYNNPSSEHIFRIINLPDDSAFGLNFDLFYNPASARGRGDLTITPDLITAFTAEIGDLRYTTLTTEDRDPSNNPARFTLKYPNGQTNESDPNVLRMGEIYLNRAEANLRGNTTIGDTPLNDVNAIRARAGLVALTAVTLEDVLLERRKELAFEGHRRMDLLRNNKNLKPENFPISAPGGNKTILPIPANEINMNPNAVQNTSY